VIAPVERTERFASAWGLVSAAPDLFGPDGRLDDRAQAFAWLAAAVTDSTGPD
jgi:hypothetical protein